MIQIIAIKAVPGIIALVIAFFSAATFCETEFN